MANPWVRRRKIELAELVNEPWTWSAPGTMFDTLVIDAFRTSGLEPPRATVYAEAINMRTRLAATGPFLAVVPASMLRFHAQHASIKKLSVELPMTQRSIGIITLKNRTLSPLARISSNALAKPPSRLRRPSIERLSQEHLGPQLAGLVTSASDHKQTPRHRSGMSSSPLTADLRGRIWARLVVPTGEIPPRFTRSHRRRAPAASAAP